MGFFVGTDVFDDASDEEPSFVSICKEIDL